MIAYLVNDKLYDLPKSLFYDNATTIRIVSDTALSCSAGSINQLSNVLYEFTLPESTVDLSITISNTLISKTIYVYYDDIDINQFVYWLHLNQLDYLVPIVTALGVHKLKEAALLANRISTGIGTEDAVRTVLQLLDLDDNVELNRIWKKGDAYAYDEMHSTSYAKQGYSLTKELFMSYYLDDLNPLTNEIEPASGTLTIDLVDLLTIMSNVLIATLQITHVKTIRLSLAISKMLNMNAKTITAYSNHSISDIIATSTSLHYETKPFVIVYDTNELLRIADSFELQAINQSYAIFDVAVDKPIFDFELLYNNSVVSYANSITGSKQFAIKPDIGPTDLTLKYRTEAGTYVSKTISIKTYKEQIHCPIYEFSQTNGYDGILRFIDPRQIIRQLTDLSTAINTNFVVPKSYQKFYIPVSANTITVVSDSAMIYDNVAGLNIPGFSTSYANLTVLGVVSDYIVLHSTDYMPRYAISVYYDGLQAYQESIYYTDEQMPKLTAETINILHHHYNAISNYEYVSINGVYANHGNRACLNTDRGDAYLASFDKLHNVHINVEPDADKFAAMSIDSNNAIIKIGDIVLTDLHRNPSFCLSKSNVLKTRYPHVIAKQGYNIDLYVDGKLMRTETDVLVFIKHNSKAMYIHVYNNKQEALLYI